MSIQAPPSPARIERATALATKMLEGRWHGKRLATAAAAIGRALAATPPGSEHGQLLARTLRAVLARVRRRLARLLAEGAHAVTGLPGRAGRDCRRARARAETSPALRSRLPPARAARCGQLGRRPGPASGRAGTECAPEALPYGLEIVRAGPPGGVSHSVHPAATVSKNDRPTLSASNCSMASAAGSGPKRRPPADRSAAGSRVSFHTPDGVALFRTQINQYMAKVAWMFPYA
jgi:hypothetical protein